jgi:RNA polymerase sigma factor (TIGR02999 family)
MEPIQPGEDVSAILQAWSEGDARALDRLTPIVYDELHRLARRYMRRERPGHGLQTTALVNEAYLRLVGYTRMRWQNRAHFFAVSAQVMRRVLVDYARRQNLKRGGGLPHLSLDDGEPCRPEPLDRILALHDALDALAALDPRKARVVEMRFFGGLSVAEVSEVLEISAVTVMRDWSSAKAWLYRELGGGAADGS